MYSCRITGDPMLIIRAHGSVTILFSEVRTLSGKIPLLCQSGEGGCSRIEVRNPEQLGIFCSSFIALKSLRPDDVVQITFSEDEKHSGMLTHYVANSNTMPDTLEQLPYYDYAIRSTYFPWARDSRVIYTTRGGDRIPGVLSRVCADRGFADAIFDIPQGPKTRKRTLNTLEPVFGCDHPSKNKPA